MEVTLCLEEMERGLRGEVAQGVVEWGAPVLGLAPAGIASVPVVGKEYLITLVLPVTL